MFGDLSCPSQILPLALRISSSAIFARQKAFLRLRKLIHRGRI
jgi:hypothetical protein